MNPTSKSILVLYSEFNAYNHAAFSAFSKISGFKVNIIHWDKTRMTAYQPISTDDINFIKRSTLTTEDIVNLLKTLTPAAVIVSGWMDKSYIRACYVAKKRGIKVIIGFDTHWRGGLKQWFFKIGFNLFRAHFFSYAFVPGNRQYYFARRLGFKHHEILTGLYTANTNLFKSRSGNGKSIIYIGRLEAAKGVKDLVEAFTYVLKENPNFNEWKLILIGEGELRSEFSNNPSIELTGFLNQSQISDIVDKAGFFCLPSWRDQWGLVIHEMAASGLPMLISDACGATEEFLIDGYNGLIFKTKDVDNLALKLKQLMGAPEELLFEYGTNSVVLSSKNSPLIWSKKVLSVIIQPN